MAICAESFLPGIADIRWMLELYTCKIHLLLRFCSLREYLMAGLAFVRDYLSICGFVVPVMAAETAQGVLMADVVVVSSPIDPHVGEKVCAVN